MPPNPINDLPDGDEFGIDPANEAVFLDYLMEHQDKIRSLEHSVTSLCARVPCVFHTNTADARNANITPELVGPLRLHLTDFAIELSYVMFNSAIRRAKSQAKAKGKEHEV